MTGDFTGDGRTDLAVANSGDNDVSILLGNGDGTFQNQVTYAVGSRSRRPRDGRLHRRRPHRPRRRQPSTTDTRTTCRSCWATATARSSPRSPTRWVPVPSAIVTGDFNGDGRTDLAVANSDDNGVSVLLGNGDGTFQTQVTYAVGSDPVALVAGDFNGDGRTDLAVANEGSFDSDGNLIPGTGDVSVLLGNGDGTFQPQVTYAAGSSPYAIVAGRLHRRRPHRPRRRQLRLRHDVSILLGNGDGTFQTQVTYAVGSDPVRPRDGRLQRRRPHRPRRRQLRLRRQRRVDAAGQRRRHLPDPGHLRGGDRSRRDRDGRLQRRRPHRPRRRQRRRRHRVGAAGQRRRHVPAPGHLRGWDFPDAIVAGDFNGDGRTDLAVANSYDNDVSVLLGNGDGTFQTQVTYAVGSGPVAIVAGDFNGDGRTDLAVANQ